MKKIIFMLMLIALVSKVHSQNITNILGTGGTFSIKDANYTYFSLRQSDGNVKIYNNIELPVTNNGVGIIYKGGLPFIHTYSNNLFMGIFSGNLSTIGMYNTGYGNNTLKSITTGSENTAFGENSLTFNRGGIGNTAMGHNSLSSNQFGYNNTAIGRYSLYRNNGNNNTGIGAYSLYNNLTTSNNTAVGYQSLYNNVADGNTAVGYNSLYGNTIGTFNTAIGTMSMENNQIGKYNTALGMYSLNKNVIGDSNSAFGYLSLYNNTASRNSAFGSSSLEYNTSGTANSSFGTNSLKFNTTGSFNSAFGSYSLLNNVSGSYNSAFGVSSMEKNISGSYNTAMGFRSLSNLVSGNNNIAIGYDAQVPDPTGSNQIRIGNTEINVAYINVPWTISSDRRLKENIDSLKEGLNFINSLRPVSYTRINDESEKTEFGLIAQEVEQSLLNTGVKNPGMLTVDNEGFYSLRYNDLLAPMIKAIQELDEKNENLETLNDRLNENNIQIESKIKQLKEVQKMILEKLGSDDKLIIYSEVK